jgi:hypothetical protein
MAHLIIIAEWGLVWPGSVGQGMGANGSFVHDWIGMARHGGVRYGQVWEPMAQLCKGIIGMTKSERIDVPNAETQKALQDADADKNLIQYKDVNEMFRDLES